MYIRKKKVLVTGGTGFIGSHLVDRLVKLQCKIIVLDNLSNCNLENLKDAKKTGLIKVVKGSVTDKKLVRQLVEDGIEVIFHLASGNLLTSLENPRQDAEVTIYGVLNLLEAIHHSKEKSKLIYSSTGSVYGTPKLQPQNEEHPLAPVSPYGISKLAAEKYVVLYHKLFNLKTVILRYYNVYGPRQNYGEKGGVVGIFINNLMHGKPLIIEGSGRQKRSFTYVSDVVEANILAASYRQAIGEVFNIASAEVTTIKQLAQLILKYFHSNLPLSHAPKRVGDIEEFMPSIDKAKRLLHFIPKVDLAEGLKKTIDWFESS